MTSKITRLCKSQSDGQYSLILMDFNLAVTAPSLEEAYESLKKKFDQIVIDAEIAGILSELPKPTNNNSFKSFQCETMH